MGCCPPVKMFTLWAISKLGTSPPAGATWRWRTDSPGVSLTLLGMVKDVFKKNLKTKLGAALVLKEMQEMKKRVDYNEYGGAPIMGASKPIYKIHGNAKAVTVKNALRLTKSYVESGFQERVAQLVRGTDRA